MFNFFESIANWFSTVADAVTSAVSNLIVVISTVIKGFEATALVLRFLPDITIGVIGVIIAYCVIVNIVNLGG